MLDDSAHGRAVGTTCCRKAIRTTNLCIGAFKTPMTMATRVALFGYSNTSDDADFLKSSWKAESPAVTQKPSRPH